jgi:hypothetical protein
MDQFSVSGGLKKVKARRLLLHRDAQDLFRSRRTPGALTKELKESPDIKSSSG